MSEPKTDVTDDGNRTDMVEMTLDGKTVKVPQDAVEILKAKEQEVKAGYQKKLSEEQGKLAEEREGIEQEREKVQSDLAYDLDWLNTHPDSADWDNYSRKIEGGDGTLRKPAGVQTTTQNAQAPFEANPQYDALKKELDSVKSTMQNNVEQTELRARQEVVIARDKILPQCNYVDEKIATSLLRNFHADNQRHPTDVEVASIINEQENRLAGIEKRRTEANVNAKFNPTSAMPDTRGGLAPLSEGTELPDQKDSEGWAQLARDDKVVWGDGYNQ